MSWIAVAVIAAPAVIGAIDAGVQKGKQKKAEEKSADYLGQQEALLESRQAVIDKSDDIRALKAQVSNPYGNLAVATQAAEMEMEQTDIALANSLDAMVSAGSSAGGATALARAAMQSKKGIAASIQQQEVNNQKLAAQGEEKAQQERMALDKAAISEEVNVYNRQEQRDLDELARLQEKEDYETKRADEHEDAAHTAMMGGLSSSAETASSMYGSGKIG
jgi:1-aminocyclopropane-1-carboxylate deaminase/D-cysteine desulfhydrase-like pyridoxal-dependent ACC family enzyme